MPPKFTKPNVTAKPKDSNDNESEAKSLAERNALIKKMLNNEIDKATTAGPEAYKNLIIAKQKEGIFPDLDATTVHLLEKERMGNHASITVVEWMRLYPGACDPAVNYKAIQRGREKILEHINTWKKKNVTLNDVLLAMVTQRIGISKEIDSKVSESEKRMMKVIEAQNEKIKNLEKKFDDQDKNVRILRYINKEILVSDQDWTDVENDFPALRKRAEDFLRLFLTKDRHGFVKRVNKLQGEEEDGSPAEFYRYRIIVSSEFIQQEILEAAEKDIKYKYAIKPGKMPDFRKVSTKRWPYTVASYYYNYRSLPAASWSAAAAS